MGEEVQKDLSSTEYPRQVKYCARQVTIKRSELASVLMCVLCI